MLPTVDESRGYDFQDSENAEKWRGIFVNSLKKVLEQVHPSLTADNSALEYVESLCLRLLGALCAQPTPLTVQDIEERVARTFPTPLDRWTLKDARETFASKRKRFTFPVDKLHHLLTKEVLQYKIDQVVTYFIAAILEYVSADIFKFAGNFFKKISHKAGVEVLTKSDVNTAMWADKVLVDMFFSEGDVAADPPPAHLTPAGSERHRRGSLTYGELVRELVTDERQFLRELNLIIRVFREEFEKILPHDTQLIELIFGNIMDIYELTVTLLGNLEDAIEMAEDSPTPYVGSCFEELAEVEEFRAYVRYTNNVTQREARDALQNLVDDPAFAERLDTAGHGFRLACKYYLPKLLLLPVGHVLLYHQYVLALLHIATAPEDIESFKQVKCNLHPITTLLSKALGNGAKMDASLRMPSRSRRQLAVEKCSELSKIVDNWEPRDIPHCCNDFIREDTISKVGPGRRVTERRAFLFDGLLLLCKPATSVVPGGVGGAGSGGGPLLKLKEKLHIRKLDIHDKPDTDEHKHLVELAPRAGAPLLLAAASLADKRSWMCDLVMLNTKPMLDRTVDSILLDLEKRHPLRLPPLERYRFAAPDDASNLLLDPDHHHHPIIKGATLLKLVERVTYHVYADLGLVRTFLTTYRAFCEPRRLLLLLQERFHVPPPNHILENVEASTGTDAEKLSKNTAREDLKRYRKEFEQPVKFRVINVIRHWVDQHFYDFEREPELLAELQAFLQTVDDKRMRKWVHSVLNTIHRKSVQSGLEEGPAHVFDHAPPPLLGFLADPQRVGFHPLCWHPIELARQLTHIEFQLFRQVKPSELVGTVWTKKDKEKTSPNLLKIIKHTTNFTRWMGKWIVESRNLEERVGVVSALLEAGVALLALNNFNGVLAVAAAMDGAAVHRLTCTFQLVSPRLLRELEYFRSLTAEHFRRYRALLRSINPPCVPFFGQYLTNIIHIEEGNPDYLGDTELINISKHRQVAKITAEIQQYQNQPYCLTPEPRAKAFLESLDPCPGLADVEKYLFDMSLELEPRHLASRADLPKFPRKYPELSVKPPKVSRRHVYPHAANADDSTQLSPTSQAGDATSISSFSMYGQDDHRSSKSDSLFSLRDKFLDLRAPTRSSARDEPPSPRERHSPRHDRSGSTSTMSVCSAAGHSSAGHSSAGHSSGAHSGGARRGALSPRSAIVDADLFYGRTAQDRMPVLLPRNSMVSTCSLAIDHEATTPNSLSDVPPEPPDRMSLEQPPERPERMPDVPDRPPDVPDRVEKPDRLLEWAEKTPDRPEKTFDRPERMPDRPEKKIDRPERPEKTPDRPEKTLDRLEWPEKTPDRPEKTIDRPEKTFDRPERPEKTPDRPEKTLDRLERPEKTPDRPEKTFDRLERPEKTPDRPEKTFDRPERPVKTPDRSEKTLDRLERPEKTPDRPEKTLDRPERPEKTPDQPEKTLDRPERPEKTPDRPEKTLDRPERPEKTPDRPEKTLDRPERPEKTPNRPEKTLDRPERPEKTPDRPEKTLDRPERPEKTPDRPERPVPSPKIQDIYRMSSASPKRSPGASASPRPNDRGTLFRFPAPLPPPTLPPPPLPGGGVPPPLPPRRRAAGPHTPRSGGSRSPPPLPPRAAPALMLVNHSTLLQRRHHNNSTLAPRLPPKPPPAAVAPRT